MAGELLLGHRGPHERLLAYQRHPGEGLAEEREVGERVLLEQRAADLGDRQVPLDQLTGEREHVGGRGLVLEPPGVAHERGVEAERRLARHREPEHPDEVAHHHPARGGAGIDHVDRPVALVRHVMVDDDQLVGLLADGTQVAESAERATVERDHDGWIGRELAGQGEQIEAREIAVVRRDDERLGERRHARASDGAQRVVHPEHRAEGVAVGVHVAQERDAIGGVDDLGRALERGLVVLVLGVHRSPSVGCRSSPSSARTPSG